MIIFETATAHYWSRIALRLGHEAKIIPAKAITPFRQGHKTDKNDALAIAEAAKRPIIKPAIIAYESSYSIKETIENIKTGGLRI